MVWVVTSISVGIFSTGLVIVIVLVIYSCVKYYQSNFQDDASFGLFSQMLMEEETEGTEEIRTEYPEPGKPCVQIVNPIPVVQRETLVVPIVLRLPDGNISIQMNGKTRVVTPAQYQTLYDLQMERNRAQQISVPARGTPQ